MYSVKNVVERLGNAEHEYGAVRFLMSTYAIRMAYGAFNKAAFYAITAMVKPCLMDSELG